MTRCNANYPKHLAGQYGWASGDIPAQMIEIGRARYRKGLPRPTIEGGYGQQGWDLEAAKNKGNSNDRK